MGLAGLFDHRPRSDLTPGRAPKQTVHADAAPTSKALFGFRTLPKIMTHDHHHLTRSEFARRAGRARSRISEACGPGGPLERAALDDRRIDAAHPAVLAWCARRDIDPSALLEPGTASPPAQLEDLLADAAEAFASRVAATLKSGTVEPEALLRALELVGSLLTDTRRRVATQLAPPAVVDSHPGASTLG